jgi:hypothetical protein
MSRQFAATLYLMRSSLSKLQLLLLGRVYWSRSCSGIHRVQDSSSCETTSNTLHNLGSRMPVVGLGMSVVCPPHRLGTPHQSASTQSSPVPAQRGYVCPEDPPASLPPSVPQETDAAPPRMPLQSPHAADAPLALTKTYYLYIINLTKDQVWCIL